jgi:ParB-like chromosome segregation protein Spo0J
MKVVKIAADKLQMDEPDPDVRTFDEEFCHGLAKSIESEGLLQEPIVQEVEGSPGHYRVLAGLHRVYACVKLLGWAEVPCKVVPASTSDDEARAIEIVENLLRLNLSDAQVMKALVDWQRIYAKRHPDAGKGSALTQSYEVSRRVDEATAAAKARGEEITDQAHEEIRERAKKEVAEERKPFAKVLEETLGVSRRTAYRLNKQATNLDTDEAGKSDRPAEPKVQEELTDAQWLEEQCGPILRILRQKGRRIAPFRRDALLYRRTAEALAKFRGAVKRGLHEARDPNGQNGLLYMRIASVSHLSHPSHWQVCGLCDGRGTVRGRDEETGEEKDVCCKKCVGGSYTIPTEP